MSRFSESWTGSERQRRPQGDCPPPSRAADPTPRFTVPAGVACEVRPVTRAEWRPHTTTRETGFDTFERFADGHFEFRASGWMLRVPAAAVAVRPGDRWEPPNPRRGRRRPTR